MKFKKFNFFFIGFLIILIIFTSCSNYKIQGAGDLAKEEYLKTKKSIENNQTPINFSNSSILYSLQESLKSAQKLDKEINYLNNQIIQIQSNITKLKENNSDKETLILLNELEILLNKSHNFFNQLNKSNTLWKNILKVSINETNIENLSNMDNSKEIANSIIDPVNKFE